jgi:predicted anti-sigma-YlaC factor YlaD
LLCGAVLSGCSAHTLAVTSLGDALARGGSVFANEDDPELARDALPASLKTIEALLNETPSHQGLLYAAASGYAEYAFGFLQQDADLEEARDLEAATALRQRAARLYLRARDYGLRGLEVSHPGFAKRLRAEPGPALAALRRDEVPLLYWTATAWAGAMALAKSDSSLSADQELAAALVTRAIALDEAYALGALHDFFIVYEGGRAAAGGSLDRAREHFRRAVELAQGRRAWPYLFLAESVSVAAQDRKEFEDLARKALAIDLDKDPQERLSNVLAQRRARWLLTRTDQLFIE